LSYTDKDTLADNLSEDGLKAAEALDVLEIFNRRPMEPWQLEIIGYQNDIVPMNSNTVKASSLMIQAVDRDVQEDARRVQWNGSGSGQVALSVANRQDFINYYSSDSALVFDIKVDAAPSATTYLRLGCGSYCASDIDLSEKLKGFTGQGWQTVTVPFKCYPTSGANFGIAQPPEEYWTQILQPFSLITSGTLDISFAKVSVVKGAGKEVACP
jgi:beta-glucosidase